MTSQRRTPGTTRIEDRWTRRDGTPSARHGTGKRWLLRWIDHNGEEKTASYTRKIDATQHEKTITAQFHNGDYIDPHNARTTISALHKEWDTITTPTIKPTTHSSRKSTWKNHVAPTWGSREVGSVRKPDIKAWISEQHHNGTGPAVLQQSLFILRAVLSHAVEAGVIVHNPAVGVKLPKSNQRPRPILTAQQVEQLARAVDYLPAIVRFLAYTGLRFGEASALTVEDIDLTRRRINVSKAYSDVEGTMVLGSTKTYETRSVPFPKSLVPDLRALTAGKPKTARVFTSVEQQVLRHNNYRRRYFRPAVDALRVAYEDFPVLTLHDLRHTAASLAISSGANVKAVQRMLGHATATETLNRYADLFPDDLDAVARGIDTLVKPSQSARSGLRADQEEKTTSPVAEEMWSDLLTYWSRLSESNR